MDNAFEKGYRSFEKNSSGLFGAVETGQYIYSVESEINKLTDDMNSFSGYNTNSNILKGDVAEFWHSGTHNIDAVVKGKNARTYVNRSNEFGSVDIDSNFGEEYGSKYYKTGSNSAKAQATSVRERYEEYISKLKRRGEEPPSFKEYCNQRGYNADDINNSIYNGQLRLIPADQMNDAVKWLERKIAEESSTRPEQVERYKETLKLLRDKIESSEGTESITLTENEAVKIAKLAKDGEFDPEEFGLTTEDLIGYKDIFRESFQAGLSAATISMILKVAPEIYKSITALIKEGYINEDDFKRIGFAAVTGASEGFIRGTIAATITGVCKSGLWGVALKGVSPPMIGMITTISMNVMKNSFYVAKGEMDQSELIDILSREMFIGSCSLILGGIGSALLIEIPVLGFMLGNFVGSVAGAFVYETGYKCFMSYCISSGYTMFGLVEQDYTLPKDVLESVGAKLLKFSELNYNKLDYKKLSYKKLEYKTLEYPSIDIKVLKRGVLAINKIGYV